MADTDGCEGPEGAADVSDPACAGRERQAGEGAGGAIPSFHSFRHTCASWAIADGDGTEEVSWQLGHKDSTVTRKIYISEVKSAERSARRRGRMETATEDISLSSSRRACSASGPLSTTLGCPGRAGPSSHRAARTAQRGRRSQGRRPASSPRTSRPVGPQAGVS
jgi:hypothetical protein